MRLPPNEILLAADDVVPFSTNETLYYIRKTKKVLLIIIIGTMAK